MTLNILIVPVHGTFAGEANLEKNGTSAHEEWWHQEHIFAQTFINYLKDKQPGTTVHWKDFQWTGANKDKERLKAAKDLYVELQSPSDVQEYDRVILIGHSHGGSVINYMLDHHDEDLNVEIYTIGTPFSHLHGLWRPFFLTSFLALLVAFVFSLVLIEPIAQFVETRPNWNTDKWESLNFWKLILPLYILLLLGWRIFQKPMFQQYKHRTKGPVKNHFRLIYHPEDEAIAALSVVPERQYNFASAVKIVSIVLAFLLFLWLSYLAIRHGTVLYETESADEFRVYIRSVALMENAKTIFLIGALCFFVPLILQVFLGYMIKPFNRFFSKILNGFLYNNGLGNDLGRIRTMNAEPQLPSKTNFPKVLHSRLEHIYDHMVADTTNHLGQTKSKVLSAMSSGHDLFTALELNKSRLSKALVHCNYFTQDMARVIVDDLLEIGKP
ncbi:hypothetical protein N9W89_08685 [Hellea sp.]|nr:hypothetical protein [Hellea sp.]